MRHPLHPAPLAPLALGLVLASCTATSVRSELDTGPLPPGARTFDFGQPEGELGPDLAEIEDQLRLAVTTELESFGLARSEEDPELLVDFGANFGSRVKYNDPFYDFYLAEEVETGTLTIELNQASTGVPLWRASGTRDLRISGTLSSVTSTDFAPTDNPRDWDVDGMVDAILEHLAEHALVTDR